MIENDPIDQLVTKILSSRKYRDLGIPRETLYDLFSIELASGSSSKVTEKSVKQKMHNLMALYLGNPDYESAKQLLNEAFEKNQSVVEMACEGILSEHASSRERLPIHQQFYPRLWEITGIPDIILDLACGLHPLAFPWMCLPKSVQYHAYDIHAPRIDLINHFFLLQGIQPLAQVQDILVNPPQQAADVAFFFKEAHRFEQRRQGSNRSFWQALPVKWLLISLPTASLTGKHDLIEKHRRLVYRNLVDLPIEVKEIVFPGEIVFCVHKIAQEITQ